MPVTGSGAAEAPVRPFPAPVTPPRTAPAPWDPSLWEGEVIDLRTADDQRVRRRFAAALVAVVVLGAVLRSVALPAGLPYGAYVDEGHVVQRADHLVAGPTWDPGWYRYPSLLPGAIAVVTGTAGLADPSMRERSQAADRSPYYDVLSPDTLLVGRLLVWAAGVGTVVVTALLATRLAGRVVGLVTAILVAATPALVSRSPIVIVDTPATFFVMAAMLAASSVAFGRRRALAAGVAGACAGLAFTSKYTAVAVIVVVVVVVAFLPIGGPRRLGLAAIATGAAVLAAVVTMPALVLRTADVQVEVARQAEIYAERASSVGYASSMTGADEVGWPLLVLGVVGLVVLLRRPRSRPMTIGWSAYVAVSAAVVLRSPYQPFRNLLPFVPFLVLGAAVALVTGCRFACHRVRRGWFTIGWLAPALATALAMVLVLGGLGPAYLQRRSVVDSRTAAVDWLASHVRGGERVLVAEELAIAPHELERIPGHLTVVPTVAPAEVPDVSSYDVVVLGRWKPPAQVAPDLAQRWPLASFGRKEVEPTLGAWRGNDEGIDIGVPFAIR